MKKLLTAFVILTTLGIQTSFAGTENENWEHNEIAVGYGYLSLPQFVSVVSTVYVADLFSGIDPALNVTSANIKTSGVFNLEYNYRFTKVFSLGLSLAAEKTSFLINGSLSSGSKSFSGDLDINLTSLSSMVNFKFFWFNKPHVSMYSKLAGGVLFIINPSASASMAQVETEALAYLDNAKVVPAAQVSLVGVDFGGETVRGFVELGAGFQGVALGGVKFRF